MIKCYKVMQLLRGANGQQFDVNHQTFTGKISKIDESLAATYNANSLDSGKLYVIDEELTEKYFPTKPIIKQDVKTDIPEKTPEQIKYDSRKEKMIAAGWEYKDELFSRNGQSITSRELLELNNVKYGKLLKS